MILEIDMGNTRLKWRVRNNQIKEAQGFQDVTAPLAVLSEAIKPYKGKITRVAVASVVGEQLESSLQEWCAQQLDILPEFMRTDSTCGKVRNGYHAPRLLGVDRWLGILAAYHQRHKACIVVSFGTAVTLDLVSVDGQHLGGYIAPGLSLMMNSLVSNTRQVRCDLSSLVLSISPGFTTSEAVYSGCAAMLRGLVENGLRQLYSLSKDESVDLIFTGGDAFRLLPLYPQAHLVPDLVLDGLAYGLDYPPFLEL